MEIQMSPRLPFGPVSVILCRFPPLLEISESPPRETQRGVWPSFAGSAFSREADLKGFLSGFPKLHRQSGAESVLGAMIEWKAGLQSAVGVQKVNACPWLCSGLCAGVGQACFSQTQAGFPETAALNLTSPALWETRAWESQLVFLSVKMGAYQTKQIFHCHCLWAAMCTVTLSWDEVGLKIWFIEAERIICL